MRVIYKYTFPIDDTCTIHNIPNNYEGFAVRHVAMQHGKPTMWIEHDVPGSFGPTERYVDVEFAIFGTGHRFGTSDARKFIGTLIMSEGHQVWHIYQR